jgi:hypothetical protein
LGSEVTRAAWLVCVSLLSQSRMGNERHDYWYMHAGSKRGTDGEEEEIEVGRWRPRPASVMEAGRVHPASAASPVLGSRCVMRFRLYPLDDAGRGRWKFAKATLSPYLVLGTSLAEEASMWAAESDTRLKYAGTRVVSIITHCTTPRPGLRFAPQ